MSFSQYLRQLGQPIAYYPQLAKPLGGVTAAILFGQLFFWQDKTSNPLGVYKTQAEIEQETGLSRREQETARKKLVELGVLVETHKRLEHRIYFKLDLAKFDALMDDIREATNPPLPNDTNEHSPMAETDIREATNPPFVNTEDYIQKNTNNNTLLTESISARTPATPAKQEKSKSKSKHSEVLILLERFGVSGQLAEDFITHRKSCKAPITETALKGFQREAGKAKISIQQAITIAIERGWRGFDASWDWQGGNFAKHSANPTAYTPPLRMNDPGCMAGQIVEIEGEIWEL